MLSSHFAKFDMNISLSSLCPYSFNIGAVLGVYVYLKEFWEIALQAQMVKKNIGQFSGFVWAEKEVNQFRFYFVRRMCIFFCLPHV